MRAPTPSEPKSTFPTYQVPQVSAMRGSAPPVQQVARAAWGGRADPLSHPSATTGVSSVITGSSCCSAGNSNIRMQSVTENCLLNSVTVPKIQRKDHSKVAHNNSDKLDSKFGALPLGRDIPNQKSDDLEVLDDLNALKNLTSSCDNNDDHCNYNYDDNDNDNNDDDDDCYNHGDDNDNDDLCRRYYHLNNEELPQLQRTSDQVFHSPPLRLRGGGESSLSTGTSGWGTPPSQQASNNNANNSSGWGTANPANQNNTGTQQWNNNANRPPTSNQGPSPQDANKANSNLNSTGQQQTPTSQPTNSTWGQPGSKPQAANNGPPPASAATSAVKTQIANAPQNTTTSTKQQLEQLNNMREAIFSQDGWGGQHVNQDTSWDIPSSPEPPMKMDGTGPAPWKPAVNNGTELWEANLRNGGQPPPQPQQKTPWGHTPSTNIGGTWGEDDDTDSSNVWTGVPSGQQQWGNTGNSGAMWGGPKKDTEWGGAAGNPGWGDPLTADPRAATMDPRDMRPDLRDNRITATISGNTATIRLMDPREQMRLAAGNDMRGDPRGITGRLNGAGAEAFWGQTGPHAGPQHIHHQNKIPVGPGNAAGWEEPSPPTQRRTMPNYDDGTSLWGNPQQGSYCKDMPTGASVGRGNITGPPGMAQSRLKPDGSVWCHGRNGSWDETGPGGWEEQQMAPWNKQKMAGTPLWENELDWGHKQGPKQALTKEMVWNSKQFRQLVDMGFKKEDVENALRIREMNVDDALDILSSMRNQDGWRSHREDHYDHQFPTQRFPSGPSGQMSFPPGSNGPNLLNNMNSSAGPSNSLINNMSPAVVQKMLAQSSGSSQGFGAATTASRSLQPQSQPSTQQLRMLVQQIQMAVQAGYLNHQILNQPLAPQTLVLLNQLLQQIKTLQQLLNNQSLAQSQCMSGKPNNNAVLQCSVLITKTKQQITNLQNQIAAQQAIYVKQQTQSSLTGGPSDIFKSTNPMHDSINALQSNFADITLKDQVNQQQSRLNQWINKDKEEGEFSRAPGSSSKPLATSPNIPLGLTQPDGPWSSGRSGDTGWPESGGGDSSNDVKDAQWPTPAQPSLTDLVPEFEPGKPWKGNQIKSIEDDPSITPGSVVRSSLSIATIKDNELFNMNPTKSPPAGDSVQPLSLSSSTWSFNPPSSTSSAFTSPQSKLPSSKGGLGDLNPSIAVTAELWGAPKSRGPPPGLSTKGISVVVNSGSNGWSSNLGSTPWGGGGGGGGQRGSGSWGGCSPWLLLRNLTAQIDGSTLRTLCMQHGPLQSFHLYLHQGFALAKYSTREEATKAQTALNNCVLGNTTILAENPSEWDANALLTQVANQQSSSGAWRGSSKQPSTGGDTWSTGWANNPTSASLWGTSALDTSDPARATPSSLNSFLPGDLLGGFFLSHISKYNANNVMQAS